MELSFISFEDHGKRATKRIQRQHVIRMQMKNKNTTGLYPPKTMGTIQSRWKLGRPQLGTSRKATLGKAEVDACLQQLARSLEYQSLRQLSTPDVFKSSEDLIFLMWSHPSRRVEERLVPEQAGHPLTGLPTLPISERRRLRVPQASIELHYAMEQGLDFLRGHDYVRATASFERSFQAVGDVIRTDHFAVMSESLSVVVHAYVFKHQVIGKMLLRQVNAMATRIFGPRNAYALWSRALLEAMSTNQFLQTVVKAAHAFADGVEAVLGPDDVYCMKTRNAAYAIEASARGADPRLGDVSEVFTIYRKSLSVVTEEKYGETWVFVLANELKELGLMMIELGLYESAMERLIGVDKLLDQAVDIVRRTKDTTSIDSSITTVYTYGMVLTGCGKFQEAETIIRKGINVATEFFGPGSLHTVQGLKGLEANYKAQGLLEEAERIKENSSEKFAPYILEQNVTIEEISSIEKANCKSE